MKLTAAVLGAGSWGTTVASLMSHNIPTILWGRSASIVQEINDHHTNATYLPGAKIATAVKATTDMEEAVAQADIIVLGVPSKAMRDTLDEVKKYVRPWVPLISLAKGLEPGTRYRMTEIIKEVLPGHPPGVLTGPNLAKEIIDGFAAASVLAMEDEVIVKQLQPVFGNGIFRVYHNTDVVGCELGGAFKNVIAIAAGMGDGSGAGVNTRSTVITRGLAEMTRLGRVMGGRASTFAGLAGMGDMMATCTSALSRNHTVGFKLGQGKKIDEIISEMNQVAEGVKTSKVVMELAQEHDIEMPISLEVYRVCHEGSTARQAFRGLLRTQTGAESEPG
ncbi:NAD(P)H-dependent glycerol-3-phosphate dehydrogenase [Parvularcula sp. IMCC14364]|uniref:NAD(P)H-dependent glycerol-3-phosphate dehydrogenase n=1 Tax=Parvularcula sp. IMCC14364 TaxID=3067902 RepID=UPI0027423C33|nr:NAD(P)H-dependent glycerol-3-phosphate dehydrogenase [Parvularcula sp. IMCC14364]